MQLSTIKIPEPEIRDWSPAAIAGALDRLANAPKVSVVIPVYNGGAAVVERCILSAAQYSDDAEIVVIDDASTDAAVAQLLQRLRDRGLIRLIVHAENLGYTGTANEALALSGESDVVLLNSDTTVGPSWLRRLRWVAYSQERIGTVSAVSDNAGAMSMPESGKPNSWAPHLTWTEISRGVAQRVNVASIATPTGHGFCMYIRRELVSAIGHFDTDAFPHGYGEENDYSRRAAKAGFENVLAPHVLVAHERSQSFGETRRAELIAVGRSAVDRLHPEYSAAIKSWGGSGSMGAVRSELRDTQARISKQRMVKPVVMYVIHRSGGGTPATNRDLLGELVEHQDSILLEASIDSVRLYKFESSEFKLLTTWTTDVPFTVTDTWRADYAAFVARILMGYNVELIHVRHLINQPLTTVPTVAKLLDIPLVLSTHDFYYVCPTVHLLDESKKFCGGKCTPGLGTCTLPTPFVAAAPDLKHNWVDEWKRRSGTVLDIAAKTIATTPSAAGIYNANYPQYADKLKLIEHGRDMSEIGTISREQGRAPGPLRIMLPANWDPHKGTDLVREVIQLTGSAIEWHAFGKRSQDFADIAIGHGEYSRENLESLVQEVDPDFIGIFSIWAETYSHTVTEAWALGIPLIVTDIGAPADRVREHGGGIIVPLEAYSTASRLLALSQDRPRWEGLRNSVPRSSIRSATTMGQDYLELYSELIGPAAPEARSVGYIVKRGKKVGEYPASVHIRSMRRILGAASLGLAKFKSVVAAEFISGVDKSDLDVIYIQRNALDPNEVSRFLEAAKTRGIRLVVDLDDDLVTVKHADGHRQISELTSEDSESLKLLLASCDVVLSSTAHLAARLAPYTQRVEVIENRLDPRVWDAVVARNEADAPAGVIRALYMGTATHAEDLGLLEEVFSSGLSLGGKKVQLEVIGITPDRNDWYSRLQPPGHSRGYPEFVSYLRANRNRWDIALAPLVDDYFNAAKSDLKLLEYAALGLPSVASNVGPYKDHRLATALVDNTPASWRKGIGQALTEAAKGALAIGTAAAPNRAIDSDHLQHWVTTLTGDHV